MAFYYLKDEPAKETKIEIEILEANGDVIRTFSNKTKEKPDKIEPKQGMNRFVWNMAYPDAEGFKGLILWAGGLRGPRAVPGSYQVRLRMGEKQETAPFEILADPRGSASKADLQAQFDFQLAVRDKLTETHESIKRIREVEQQLDGVTGRLDEGDDAQEIRESAKALKKSMKEIEEALYQTKNRSRQDPLNYPIRLNNKLSALARVAGMGDNRPTDAAVAVKAEITKAIDAELSKLNRLLDKELPAFNKLVRKKKVPAVSTGSPR